MGINIYDFKAENVCNYLKGTNSMKKSNYLAGEKAKNNEVKYGIISEISGNFPSHQSC